MPPDIDAVNRYFTDDYYGWGKTSLNFPNSKSPGTCLSPYPSCKLTSPLNFSFSHSPSACLAHTDLVQALISQPSNPLSDSPRSIERIQILWQEDQGSESTFPTTPSRPSPETNLLAGEILHFAPVIAFKENPSPVPSPNDTIFSAGHWQSVFLKRASDGSVLDGLGPKDTRGRRLLRYYDTIGDMCGEPEIDSEWRKEDAF